MDKALNAEMWSKLKGLETKIAELKEQREKLAEENLDIEKQLNKAYAVANACKVLLREEGSNG